jgi:integrase
MSFHKRKSDGLWFVKYYEAGKERRLYTTAGRQGEIEAQELDARIKREGPPKPAARPGDVPTFFFVARQYIDQHLTNAYTKQVIRWNLNKWVADLFGSKPVNTLSMRDLLDLDQAMTAAGKSQATINRIKAYCRAILSWAVEYDLAPANPFSKFKARKEAPGPEPPTWDELEKIRQAAPPHLLWAVECMLHLGVRPGPTELFAIRISDVDFKRGGVYLIRHKTQDKPVFQPVRPEFLSRLETLRSQEPDRKYLVEYHGEPVASLRKTWGTTLRRAGITRRLRLYDLRHWYATQMLRNGADVKAVSELMGHANVQTTLRVYYHVIEAQKRAALDHLPAMPQIITQALIVTVKQ